MGWTGTNNDFDGINDFVDRELRHEFLENFEVIASEVVAVEPLNYSHVVYSAVRDNTDGSVSCAVDLVDFNSDSVYWKSLSDSMGPVEDECPARILKLLTRPAKSEIAEEWIRRCERNLARRDFAAISRDIDREAEKAIDQAVKKQRLIDNDIISGTMKTHAGSIDAPGPDGAEITLGSPWMTTLHGFSAGEIPNYVNGKADAVIEYLKDLQTVDAFFDLAVEEEPEFARLELSRPEWSDREAVKKAADEIVAFAEGSPHLMEALARCVEKAEPDISVKIGHGEKDGKLILFSGMDWRPALYAGIYRPEQSLSISFRETDLPKSARQFKAELEKTLRETFPGLKGPAASQKPKG